MRVFFKTVLAATAPFLLAAALILSGGCASTVPGRWTTFDWDSRSPEQIDASQPADTAVYGCATVKGNEASAPRFTEWVALAKVLSEFRVRIRLGALEWGSANGTDKAVAEVSEARGADSSPQWREVRDRYAAAHPLCAFCGREAVEVHHIMPFHLFPLRELDPDNLISLCRVHHFIYGHGGDWKSYNPDVLVDKEFWKAVRAVKPTE